MATLALILFAAVAAIVVALVCLVVWTSHLHASSAAADQLRRIESLERTNAWLDARLRALEHPAASSATPERAGDEVSTPQPSPPPDAPETPPGQPQVPEALRSLVDSKRKRTEADRQTDRATQADANGAPPPRPPPTASRHGDGRSSPRQPVAWERWVGVRGAAALGASVLVLAGLYFFRYGIEAGLITPALRVALGTGVGASCLIAGETILRRRHGLLANWLAGAGFALLYLSFWAASAVYGLVPAIGAGVLMVLVTAGCCALAVRRQSMAIAVLGLLGGFATPILLSTGSDRPVALFSYLLVLDAAMLYVARRRRWPILAVFALAGTATYQALWVGTRMGGEQLWLGIGIVLVFAALFVAGTRTPRRAGESPTWTVTRIVAALLPFPFALYFGVASRFGDHVYPVAAQLATLVVGSCWLARRDKTSWLDVAATCGAAGVFASWLMTHEASGGIGWEVMGFAVGLALVLQLFAETGGERREHATMAPALWALSATAFTALETATTSSPIVWPFLLGWAALALVGMRAGSLGERPALLPLSAGALGFALALLNVSHAGREGFFDQGVMAALMVATALVFGFVAGAVRRPPLRAASAHASALLSTIVLAQLIAVPSSALEPLALVAATLVLGLLICLAALRAGAGSWVLAAVVVSALVQSRWASALPRAAAPDLELAIVAHAAAIGFFSVWPFLVGRRAAQDLWLWRAAALAGVAFFPSLVMVYERRFGDDVIAVVPIALASVTIAVAYGARGRGPREARARRSALAWLGAVAIGFVTVAVPLQLENEWVTIAWALQGVATLALWRRVGHVGLKYVGLALLAAVTARLVMNPWVLEYYPRGPVRIVNWIAYTYLVPAACLLGGARILGRVEVARLTRWERELPGAARGLGARGLALAAIAVTFVWINLAIVDWYAVGAALQIPTAKLPARDLTLSLAWAVYALSLLGLGAWRKNGGLRHLSLALLLVTCGKVFLHDLSHLRDLYRVASLAGLALSLIAVSLAYQRIVFRKSEG